jgi:hypothetical protein
MMNSSAGVPNVASGSLKQSGIHVTVWADQRQAFHLAVQLQSHVFLPYIRSEKPVFWERKLSHSTFALYASQP